MSTDVTYSCPDCCKTLSFPRTEPPFSIRCTDHEPHVEMELDEGEPGAAQVPSSGGGEVKAFSLAWALKLLADYVASKESKHEARYGTAPCPNTMKAVEMVRAHLSSLPTTE